MFRSDRLNAFRTSNPLRTGLIMAALLSWIAFSNRCALGQLLSCERAVAVQHGCCDNEDRQQAPANSDSHECCKAFHALSDSSAKAPLMGLVMQATIAVFHGEIPRAEVCVSRVSNTGPPAASCFVELVLHRSLRSHAPPICA